jgi:hypothetical protein
VPHRISEFIITIADYIPGLFLDEHSPQFLVLRAMSLLIVVAFLIAVLALLGASWFRVVAYVKKSSRKRAPGPANSTSPQIDMR